MTKKQKKIFYRIIATIILLVVIHFIPLEKLAVALGFKDVKILAFIIYLIPYFVIGIDILRKAILGIIHREVFDECFLMVVATIGALIVGLMDSGDYLEAVSVMLFYQIGELFQAVAVGKSRKNISSLMDIRPDKANLEAGADILVVDPGEVAINSTVIVRPGEKIPIDGIIVEGKTQLNTAALTGESTPRDVKEGDNVTSGSINLTSLIKVRTTATFDDSTVSKILNLVENASISKSKSEDFIGKFARIYTPTVCGIALGVFVFPILYNFLSGNALEITTWLYRALTFLVISCPCALVISIPLTFFAGLGSASRDGILIKGSNYLEKIRQVKTIVFDKTGTLTEGVFEVVAIHENQITPEELLENAAYTESASIHPVAKSILRKYGKNIDHTRLSNIVEISGKGIMANFDGKKVACGNSKMMDEVHTEIVPCTCQGNIVHISIDGDYAGHIVISDIIKKTAAETISLLRKKGVKDIIMLTGDNASEAKKVADTLNIREYASGLLPQNKVEKIEYYLSKKEATDILCFIGDGINDAPVLMRADIGIAMGGLGSDAAIEAADVVLMDDDPRKIIRAINISQKCMRIVYENISFCIIIKVLTMIFGALGIATMWWAIFADVGVMVICVINSIRALR